MLTNLYFPRIKICIIPRARKILFSLVCVYIYTYVCFFFTFALFISFSPDLHLSLRHGHSRSTRRISRPSIPLFITDFFPVPPLRQSSNGLNNSRRFVGRAVTPLQSRFLEAKEGNFPLEAFPLARPLHSLRLDGILPVRLFLLPPPLLFAHSEILQLKFKQL